MLTFIRKYFKKRKLYILGIAFCIIEAALGIIMTFLMGDIVNNGIMSANKKYIFDICKKMFIAAICMGLSGYFYFILCNISCFDFSYNLRNSATKKYLKQNIPIYQPAHYSHDLQMIAKNVLLSEIYLLSLLLNRLLLHLVDFL